MCRRWRRLSQAPQLRLRLGIELTFNEPDQARLLPSLRSLCTWMAYAAGHVRELVLQLGMYIPLLPAEQAEEESLLASIVAACGAGGLQCLQLGCSTPVRISSWISMARDLRWLHLSGYTGKEDDPGSELTAPLRSLSRLEHLSLSGLRFDVAEGALPALPPLLTSLDLITTGYSLPSQVCHQWRVGGHSMCM